MKRYKPIIRGSLASLSLLSIYFIILTWANSLEHAIGQFIEMWYWILILSIGFGLQIGLYYHIKAQLQKKMLESKAELAATGTVSTVSMVVCCAHHIVDILPILGLSAAATFLLRYQLSFIMIGVLSNILGITSMLVIMQKHSLHEEKLKLIYRYDMKNIMKIGIFVSVILVSLTFVL